MDTVVVVGNPRLGSRTRQAAELVVQRLTGAPPTTVIELAELGPALLDWGDPATGAAKDQVLAADLFVVASPVFKASLTGLLKLFLDHPQQILDRDTIGNATRGREPMPLDRIVDMAVSRLRQRLRDTDKPPRLIRTVRGSGYLLAAHVCNAP